MKKILLLTTGGTIASQQGKSGLEPKLASKELLAYVDGLQKYYEVEYKDILNLDSSNIQPEEWRTIARSVYQNLDQYDGIVITHGTDTMAYTASMLCFMLQNLNKSIVLTGSQMPIDAPLTDARTNLYSAFAAVDSGIKGVSIAFNRKIINGCRAVKTRTMGFDAFESVNAPFLGEIFSDGFRVNHLQHCSEDKIEKTTILSDQICTDVFLLKLIPSTKPEIFDVFLTMNYKGLVIETFGAGGMHFIRRDLSAKLQKLADNGMAVVACSQCLYDRSDFSLYEVGQKMLSSGVIPGRDMTSEAAVTKLMWALGQTSDLEEVRLMFDTNYAGEVTLL